MCVYIYIFVYIIVNPTNILFSGTPPRIDQTFPSRFWVIPCHLFMPWHGNIVRQLQVWEHFSIAAHRRIGGEWNQRCEVIQGDFLQEHEDIKEKVMKSLKESDDLLRKARLLLKDSEGRSEGLCEKPKEVSEAEAVARRQLQHVKQNPSHEAREKGFKDLLRVWHPDKNPENPEVATVVFQMLQAERGGI